MDVFCFTFGVGSPLAKYYVMITAPDELTARAQMYCLFETHWASCYRLLDFQSQIAQYGYQPLDVNHEASVRLCSNHDDIPSHIYNKAHGILEPLPGDN